MTDYALVRVRRPNGLQVVLRVPAEHVLELIDRVAREFGSS